MKLDDALNALGRQMHVPALGFDEAGVCRMVFDGDLIVDCERLAGSEECGYLYSVVASLPAEGREGVYARLLGANLFGDETGEAVFAIDEVAGEILLQQRIDAANLNEGTFAAAVEAFVHVLEEWRERLRTATDVSPATHAGMPPGMMHV
ncbi:MAG TPA: type III secretion system chaperone [Azoarcus sp.]|nr:type III secretion system chaperone [Azoarcus sp.]